MSINIQNTETIMTRVPRQIITNIFSTYENNMMSIKVNSVLTDGKPINQGVQQGCGLLPKSAKCYDRKISRAITKVIAFRGKDLVASKITL
jgi:hypothetical protein